MPIINRGLAGKAGIVAAEHRTQNFYQPAAATRSAATDNMVSQYALHRHSTETWLTLYRKVHVSAVIESLLCNQLITVPCMNQFPV